jgi:hypothetical protein
MTWMWIATQSQTVLHSFTSQETSNWLLSQQITKSTAPKMLRRKFDRKRKRKKSYKMYIEQKKAANQEINKICLKRV